MSPWTCKWATLSLSSRGKWAELRQGFSFGPGTLVVSVCGSCPDAFRMILRGCGVMMDHCTSIQTLDRCSSRRRLLKVRISKLKRPPVCFWWNLDGWLIRHRSADASIIRRTCCDLNVKSSSFYHRLKRSVQNDPKNRSQCFSKAIYKMLDADPKALQVRPCTRRDTRSPRPPWHRLWRWHPRTQGSGSHLAAPGSDLSNHTELAKHHTPASVLSGGSESGRATGERCADGW